MGLTRVRADQISDIDYKQAVRVVSTTNVDLNGGAPRIVDGVTLVNTNRVLVAGQSTGSENGIYVVQTAGTGSNGTWVRTYDADTSGEVNAGMILMVTEGGVYADTLWKLLTDDPIAIGTSNLVFSLNSPNSFITFNANGTALTPNSLTSTVFFNPGNNIVITGNNSAETIVFALTENPSVTGNIFAAGYISATGNILTGSNILISGYTSVGGNITATGNVLVDQNIVAQGNASVTGNIQGANILTAGTASATGNVYGNTIFAATDVSAAGNVTATYYKGDGSYLTGLYGVVGEYYFANIASSVNPYYQAVYIANFVPTAAATVTVTVADATPVLLNEFLTNVGYPNQPYIPVGAIVVDYETQKTGGNSGYTTYAEIWKRTTGGTETLLLTSDVSSTSTLNTLIQQSVSITNTTNITLDVTDRIAIKIYAQVLTGPSASISLRWDDNTGSGFHLPAPPTSITQFVPYLNATANLNLGSYSFTTTGNVNASNVVTANTVINNNISTAGNVTGGNVDTGGLVSATGNILTGANLLVDGYASVAGNITSNNLLINNNATITGNLVVNGNTTFINSNTITINDKFINLANNASTQSAADGAGIGIGPVGAEYANIKYVSASNSWTLTNDTTVSGAFTATGNVVGANVDTAGLITATGNILTGANLLVGGYASIAGNVTATGNVLVDQNIVAQGFVSITGNIQTANLITATGNILTGANLLVAGYTSIAGNVTATGNVLVDQNIVAQGFVSITGNIQTANLITATGNIVTGSNVIVAGYVTTTGNITGGNLLTSGLTSATGNITGGNLLTAGQISATGNVTTAGYFIGTFQGNISGNITAPGSNTQVIYNNQGNAAGSTGFTFDQTSNALVVTGNITGGNLSTAGNVFSGGLGVTGNTSLTGFVTVVGSGAQEYTTRIKGGTAGAQFAIGTSNAANYGISLESVNYSDTEYANLTIQAGNLAVNTGGTVANTVLTINSTGQISASGNIQAANLLTAGSVTATGNIATANYFVGDGRYISNIATISNGTSNVSVVTANGDVAISTHNTTNVAVIGTGSLTLQGAFVNPNTITSNVTVGENTNGMLIGPIVIGSSGCITIPSSSRVYVFGG